jgi:hypothetical protein
LLSTHQRFTDVDPARALLVILAPVIFQAREAKISATLVANGNWMAFKHALSGGVAFLFFSHIEFNSPPAFSEPWF